MPTVIYFSFFPDQLPFPGQNTWVGYSGIAENIRKLLFSQGWSPHPNPTVTLRSFVRQHPVATCRRIAAVTLPWRFPATVLICLLNKSWKIELILDSINKMENVGEHGNTFFCSELKLVHFSNNQTWEFMCHRSVKVTPVLGTYHGCKEMFLSIQLYDGKNCGKRKGFPPAMCQMYLDAMIELEVGLQWLKTDFTE